MLHVVLSKSFVGHHWVFVGCWFALKFCCSRCCRACGTKSLKNPILNTFHSSQTSQSTRPTTREQCKRTQHLASLSIQISNDPLRIRVQSREQSRCVHGAQTREQSSTRTR